MTSHAQVLRGAGGKSTEIGGLRRSFARPIAWAACFVMVAVGAVLGAGFLLDEPQADPPLSDAIVVISGDEQLARFREGVRLYQAGLGRFLVFSGAAKDQGPSNADVMRQLAEAAGVPASAILEDPQGQDTWGNAVYTRRVLDQKNLRSAILVTSPYHVRRALMTFSAAYSGSGIHLTAHAAPDSEWRKLSWWRQPSTRQLTFTELSKLAYILVTRRYD